MLCLFVQKLVVLTTLMKISGTTQHLAGLNVVLGGHLKPAAPVVEVAPVEPVAPVQRSTRVN